MSGKRSNKSLITKRSAVYLLQKIPYCMYSRSIQHAWELERLSAKRQKIIGCQYLKRRKSNMRTRRGIGGISESDHKWVGVQPYPLMEVGAPPKVTIVGSGTTLSPYRRFCEVHPPPPHFRIRAHVWRRSS